MSISEDWWQNKNLVVCLFSRIQMHKSNIIHLNIMLYLCPENDKSFIQLKVKKK